MIILMYVIFMRDIPSRVRSQHVENLINDFDLSDPFRVLNPETREFTQGFCSKSFDRKQIVLNIKKGKEEAGLAFMMIR
jgi:hypothetical protein